MMKQLFMLSALAAFILGGCQSMSPEINIEAEKAAIEKVIKNNIGWAVEKDTTLLYSTISHDDDLFYFSPADNGNISGFKAFKELTEGFFLNPDFKAVGYEVKDLVVHLSKSGDAAWWHCRLDDFNQWKGQPANWVDVRWTGVLEKREGNWVIVQMHFSFPTDAAE